MAVDQINNFAFTFTFRPAPESGPTSSDDWNDSFSELANDLANIALEWNNKLKIVIDGLPCGLLDTQVNVFTNGLDGKNLWVDKDVESTSNNLLFFNINKNRPNTVKEQFESTILYIDQQIAQTTDTILASSEGLTTDQKNRIGANIFDNTQLSSSISLDGKSEINRLNVIQLAGDVYGNTAQLNNNGIGILTNANIFEMVSQLLAIHNSAWNTGIVPNHTGVLGTVSQDDVTSSSPGNDSFVGLPAHLRDDLNQIRTILKNLKGTPSWISTLSSLYIGGADSLEDLLVSTKGTSTKTSTNPWGYNYSDITGISTRFDAIQSFTGQNSHTDGSPIYSSNVYITNGDSLETSIGKLDNTLSIQSGIDIAVLNHLETLRIFVGQDDATDSTPSYSGTFVNDNESLELSIHRLDGILSTIVASGANSFLGLLDTPATYLGSAGKRAVVNATETAIEFVDDELQIGDFTVSGMLNVSQDIEITQSGFGIVMSSPNGTKFRLQVDNGGNLITTAI